MFTFFIDPGHGWLRVYADDLRQVGMCAADFSRYSYQANGPYKGLRYYLEEDCDAPKFLEAWKRAHPGEEPRIVESHEAGFIRSLPHINQL